MYKEKIVTLIEQNEEVFNNAFLRRFPSEDELQTAEDILGLKIPEDYKWFLQKYGHGGFFFEFLGYGLNGKAMFVEETLKQREYGLPLDLLVIENCDEYVVCINVNSGNVVSWSRSDNDGGIKMEDSFLAYFLDCVENAIDNY